MVDKYHKSKTVTLHHHHARPYRKRHFWVLILLISLVIFLVAEAVQYRTQIISSINGSSHFVSDLFSGSKNYSIKLHSTYGFNLTYDQKNFYASAIDASSGNLYLGTDLAENRAYSVVRVTPTIVNSTSTQSSLTMTYHHETNYPVGKTPTLSDLKTIALSDASVNKTAFVESNSRSVMIGGQNFLQTTWLLRQSISVTAQISSELVTYVGLVNTKPITIAINYGIGGSSLTQEYDAIVQSISFGSNVQAYVPQTNAVALNEKANKSIIDTVLMSHFASAASSDSSSSTSEKVAALYGPAVVKIYNAYCMDIAIDGQSYLTDACNGGITGSGFFVSQDGYIATNGHVATSDPKSIVIEDAISNFSKGNTQYLQKLIGMTGLTQNDITGLDAVHTETKIVNALYALADSRFSASHVSSNLLVGLTGKEPDVTSLLAATTARKQYPQQDSIMSAKVVASDYRAIDGPTWGLSAYSASDVAIIKIEGTNYPVTKIGSINDITQGANLMVLGYPGNATNNGLVDATTSTVTLTTGKVSAIKNAAGSNKKLIETDTTIGHGNSGGPALSDSGKVVGIATYTADGSGTGDGTFNYIRDIKDLQDLATASKITFDTNSKSQNEWQQGIDYFYTAHYTKALVNFNNVKKIYPDNSRVDEFIAAANQRIIKGEDVKDFPVIPYIISGIVLLIIGIVITIIIIIRHNKHHILYNKHVAAGTVQAMKPGSMSQQVIIESKKL
jgi:S1-C subfamily serine protease